jgi:chromosomal replication initiator protein
MLEELANAIAGAAETLKGAELRAFVLERLRELWVVRQLPAGPGLRPVFAEAVAVMEDTASRAGLSLQELRSLDRSATLAKTRAIAMWRVRQLGLSYPEIGRLFGRDHTSVIAAVRKIDATLPEAS